VTYTVETWARAAARLAGSDAGTMERQAQRAAEAINNPLVTPENLLKVFALGNAAKLR